MARIRNPGRRLLLENPAPSPPHTDRKDRLLHLALANGYSEAMRFSQPDSPGRYWYPDVLQLNPGTRALFVREAKATETTGNSATRKRLRNYFSALRWSLVNDEVATCVIALAAGELGKTERWALALDKLARSPAGRLQR